jgi:hypothetical protein
MMDFTGRPLKGFIYVDPPGIKTAAALAGWLDRGLTFVQDLNSTPRRRQAHAAPPPAKRPGSRATPRKQTKTSAPKQKRLSH